MARRPAPAVTLLRGDAHEGVVTPTPSVRTTIVEHVLYLGGYGRATPFTSTTASPEAAEHFAGPHGAVWQTAATRAEVQGAKHWSQAELESNLRGFGKGRAKWHDRWEVAQARLYVIQWSEHLLEWSGVDDAVAGERIKATFDKRRGRS